MNPWLALLLAGVFEVGFTTSLKLSESFTRPWYVVLFFASAALSFGFLTVAIKTLPLGTAYAVWTGIGAAGTALVGIFFFQDSANFLRICFLALLVFAIVGLKFVSAEAG